MTHEEEIDMGISLGRGIIDYMREQGGGGQSVMRVLQHVNFATIAGLAFLGNRNGYPVDAVKLNSELFRQVRDALKAAKDQDFMKGKPDERTS